MIFVGLEFRGKMETGSPSKGRFKLYEELELQEFQDKFVIKSAESSTVRGFSIDRYDGQIEPLSDHSGDCSCFPFLVNFFLRILLLISNFQARFAQAKSFHGKFCENCLSFEAGIELESY